MMRAEDWSVLDESVDWPGYERDIPVPAAAE